MAAESGLAVANVGAPKSDGIASAAFCAGGTGTSVGFNCSTSGTERDEDGVVTVADLAKTEELAKKFGIPEDVDAALDVDVTVVRRVGAGEVTFVVSGVGGTSDIVGRAGAGVGETVI